VSCQARNQSFKVVSQPPGAFQAPFRVVYKKGWCTSKSVLWFTNFSGVPSKITIFILFYSCLFFGKLSQNSENGYRGGYEHACVHIIKNICLWHCTTCRLLNHIMHVMADLLWQSYIMYFQSPAITQLITADWSITSMWAYFKLLAVIGLFVFSLPFWKACVVSLLL